MSGVHTTRDVFTNTVNVVSENDTDCHTTKTILSQTTSQFRLKYTQHSCTPMSTKTCLQNHQNEMEHKHSRSCCFFLVNEKTQSRTRQNTPPKPSTWPLSTPRAQTAPDHLTLGAQPENKPLPSPWNTQGDNTTSTTLEDFSQANHHKKSFVS